LTIFGNHAIRTSQHLLRSICDIIKIDGTLVKHLDTDPAAYSAHVVIQQMPAGLGMQTSLNTVPHSSSDSGAVANRWKYRFPGLYAQTAGHV